MYWTKAHDTLLCREVLALEPYKHKKGSNEAGKIWTDIAQSLKNCQQLKFKQNLSQRAGREFPFFRLGTKRKKGKKHGHLEYLLNRMSWMFSWKRSQREKKPQRRTEEMSIERKRIITLLLKKCENKQWKG